MENVKENTTVYCVNNCGFFGSPNTNNLCSKCYSMKKKRKEIEDAQQTDSEKLKQQKVESIPELDLPKPKEEEKTVPIETIVTKAETEPSTTTTPTTAVDPTKCYSCNKKIGLTAIKCRCGFKFCGKHRYSDQHNCSYDYKESGKKELTEKNPKVGASKLVAL